MRPVLPLRGEPGHAAGRLRVEVVALGGVRRQWACVCAQTVQQGGAVHVDVRYRRARGALTLSHAPTHPRLRAKWAAPAHSGKGTPCATRAGQRRIRAPPLLLPLPLAWAAPTQSPDGVDGEACSPPQLLLHPVAGAGGVIGRWWWWWWQAGSRADDRQGCALFRRRARRWRAAEAAAAAVAAAAAAGDGIARGKFKQ